MKILCDCNIVNARKEGKWMHYSLNREAIKNLNTLFENYLKEGLESSRNCSCKY
jgi:ArsR family transcriptional regulator